MPEARADHAAAVATMALELPRVVREISERHGRLFQVRVGLHIKGKGPMRAWLLANRADEAPSQ